MRFSLFLVAARAKEFLALWSPPKKSKSDCLLYTCATHIIHCRHIMSSRVGCIVFKTVLAQLICCLYSRVLYLLLPLSTTVELL